ncbi:serine/threonine-protein kinase [Halomicronema sp. CCY15110]|uniref:serine/threonine-protein kinase n=1 Tax=Halomicronema sp. CCY15110 TaxID=2767773 RepID=UPI0019507D8D|nr:serine/threonine-protein kinase [Halomicronema sp. CCY15110]
MSLCINPSCPQPVHPDNSRHVTCQACGSGLLLQGQYRVMRLLSSSSGFGLVYEAYQQDQPKILKVLRPDRTGNPKILSLFRKEAEVLSQLHHPGVPLVEADGYFVYRPQDGPPLHCMVMEKIDGPNLLQWMQQQGNHPIGERQAFQWLYQLTEILRRVHQRNYFHRDIKPDNVMLRSSGQLVLVDFGAAREMSQTYLAQVSGSGVTTISSAGYTPPEQEQGQAVPQSDFYALGRTIIFLLTGRSPNDPALYDPMLNLFKWRSHAPTISDEFAHLLESLVSPRVIDRPKTAQELLDRLQKLSLSQFMQQGDEVALHAITSPPMVDGTTQASGFQMPASAEGPTGTATDHTVITGNNAVSRWTWLIVGGVTFAAMVLIGIGIWSRQRSQPPAATVPSGEVNAIDLDSSTPAIRVELMRTLTSHTSSINGLQLMSDQRRFVSASADNTIRLWDLSTGEIVQTFTGHETFVNAIALSPDELTLYSGSADGALLAWQVNTAEPQATFAGHESPINVLARNPDGRLLVSGGSDGTIKIWDTNTQALVQTLIGHEGAVNTLIITNDGQRIITGSADRTIRVWELQTGEALAVLVGHDSYINAIAASPDGRYLFSASADQTLKRWDLDAGEVLETLSGHTSFVNVLTVSRDGQTLASGSADETVRLWDVATGELKATYTGFGMPIDHLLLPSEKQIVTASRENSAIKAWTLQP